MITQYSFHPEGTHPQWQDGIVEALQGLDIGDCRYDFSMVRTLDPLPLTWDATECLDSLCITLVSHIEERLGIMGYSNFKSMPTEEFLLRRAAHCYAPGKFAIFAEEQIERLRNWIVKDLEYSEDLFSNPTENSPELICLYFAYQRLLCNTRITRLRGLSLYAHTANTEHWYADIVNEFVKAATDLELIPTTDAKWLRENAAIKLTLVAA